MTAAGSSSFAPRAMDTFSPRTRAALAAVERRAFVPEEFRESVHDQHRIPLPGGRSLPPVQAVAQMLDALEVKAGEKVLQVGTGGGYTAALLGHLGGRVYSLERSGQQAGRATEVLAELGIDNVEVICADGLEGLPEEAPFDAILVSATGLSVPRGLLEQLTVGGRLVIPVGPYSASQKLYRITRQAEGDFLEESRGEVKLSPLLGDILVRMADVKEAEMDRAAAIARNDHRLLGQVLLELGSVEERDLYRALAWQKGFEFGTIDEVLGLLDFELVQTVARQFLIHNQLLPLCRDEYTAWVATSNHEAKMAELASGLDRDDLRVILVTPGDFQRLWTLVDMGTIKPALVGEVTAPVVGDLMEKPIEHDARAVEIFDALLFHAILERASDIHLERYPGRVRVRLRVDGDLRELTRVPIHSGELDGVINVLKIQSKLDISERRRPQGGRMTKRAAGVVYDLRVQTQPGLHGECVVIRLLPQERGLLDLGDLGLLSRVHEPYRRLLHAPSGLVLVVGPTGSGKSTTIYAGLQILARDARRKVITVEDPIEYAIEGIQQVQINPAVGFGFAEAVRSFLRLDPDVIIVGEIRDHDTALEAIRASQTGHVVLSTLHSNDAVDAVQRLFDLNIHANSLASELQGVLAQRLARRNCTHCVREVEPNPKLVAEIFPSGLPAGFHTFRGAGCGHCRGFGTLGRVAVAEFLQASPALREAIARRLPVDELRRVSLGDNLLTMRTSALELVRQGTIPLEELPRLLSVERLKPEREEDL